MATQSPEGANAIREELERASSLIAFQPGVGARARNVSLPGIRRLHIEGHWGLTPNDSGFLSGRRVLHNGVGQSPKDILTRFTHANGNVIREDWSGGDPATLSTADGCAEIADPKYRIDHTWQFGSLATSQHNGSNFFGLDLTIDPNTGLASASRDTALVPTSYLYDAMGRLTSVTPQGAARTTYEYLNAGGANAPATVVIKQFDVSGTMLTQADVQYDSFGRVWKERQLMPDGTWPIRETRRNVMGWLDRVSEREITPTNWTIYGAYDPFGRVGSITAPDNKVTSFTYKGIRETRKRSSVSGNDAFTTHRSDSLGRLQYVLENEPDPVVTTEYGYDVGDRLVSVTMVGNPPSPTQSRIFEYDGRGFLTSETHPETGKILHGLYDARGHALSRSLLNDPWPKLADLFYTYDAAERLTNVNVRNPADPNNLRVLKQFSFGSSAAAGDRSAGKLTSATRFNYGPSETVEVTERYLYQDLAGRPTSKITEVKVNSVDRQKFQQSFTYTDLGTPGTLTYPTCILMSCGTSSSNETLIQSVSQGYTRGLLTSIYGTRLNSTLNLASEIRYHPSGMMKSVLHGNGVMVDDAADPHGMGRPRSITVSNAIACDPPAITQHPQSISIMPGATTRLTVTASGTGTFSYQWYEGVAGNMASTPRGGNVPWLDVSPPSTTIYWVHITNSCGSAFSINAQVTVTSSALTAPTNLIATAASATQVNISWGAVSGAASYQIERRAAGGTLTLIQNVTSTTYLDIAEQDKAYVYRVRAVSGAQVSQYSIADLATTVIHVDIPLVAGAVVRASHFEKLRTAVNAVRNTAGMAAANWTSSSDQIIKRVHLIELRDRLSEARTALGLNSGSFTDPNIVVGVTQIKAIHVTELRERTQ